MALSTMGARGARGSHGGHPGHHHSMDPGGGNGGAVFGDIVVYVQEVNPRRGAGAGAGEAGGGKRPLTLKSWMTIKDVKQTLQTLLHVPMSKQRLFFNGRELEASTSASASASASNSGCNRGLRELRQIGHSLQDCGIVRDGETIYFAIAPPAAALGGGSGPVLRTYGLLTPPKRLMRSLKQVRRAMELGINAPKLSMEGFGGTYFMLDPRKRPLACFKPADEEPYAPNNPRGPELVADWGMVGKELFSMRPGVRPGEGYLREVASHLLDHGGFAGVPATTVVEARHPAFHYPPGRRASNGGGGSVKVGSFQEYVRHDFVVEDLSPSLFAAKEVQKVALLDLRLLNSDRNGGNILVRRHRRRRTYLDAAKGGGGAASSPMSAPAATFGGGGGGGHQQYEYELIPIDHGYCLPETICIDDPLNLCWFEWRQCKAPLEPEVKAYIAALDAEADAALLKATLGIREPALDNLRASTLLLQKAAAAGLTLYDVARLVVRERPDLPSELEQAKETAESLAHAVARSSLAARRAGVAAAPSLPPSRAPSFTNAAAAVGAVTTTNGAAQQGQQPEQEVELGMSLDSEVGGIGAGGPEEEGGSLRLGVEGLTVGSSSSSSSDASEAGQEGRQPSQPQQQHEQQAPPPLGSLKIRLDVIEGHANGSNSGNGNGVAVPAASSASAGGRGGRGRAGSTSSLSPASPTGFWNVSMEEMHARAAAAAATAAAAAAAADGGGEGAAAAIASSPLSPALLPVRASKSAESSGSGSGSSLSEGEEGRGIVEDEEEEEEDDGYSWTFDMEVETLSASVHSTTRSSAHEGIGGSGGDGDGGGEGASSPSPRSAGSNGENDAAPGVADAAGRTGKGPLKAPLEEERADGGKQHDYRQRPLTRAMSSPDFKRGMLAPPSLLEGGRHQTLDTVVTAAATGDAGGWGQRYQEEEALGGLGLPPKSSQAALGAPRLARGLSEAGALGGLAGQAARASSGHGHDHHHHNGGGKAGSLLPSRRRREQAVRESEEFRRCLFHYLDLLLQDLVTRRARAKAREEERRRREAEAEASGGGLATALPVRHQASASSASSASDEAVSTASSN